MSPEQVDADLVDKAYVAIDPAGFADPTAGDKADLVKDIRGIIAAVLPDIQAQALEEAAGEVIGYAWQPGDAPARVMPVGEQGAYMAGANDAHAIVDRLLRASAARLTTTTEEGGHL